VRKGVAGATNKELRASDGREMVSAPGEEFPLLSTGPTGLRNPMDTSDSFGADLHQGVVMQRLMTIKEVADYLRLSKVTVYKMTREGKIPASKIGKQWRYNEAEIDKWVKQKSNSKHR